MRRGLVYVFAHAMSADRLLRGQLAYMRERGFDVSVIASPDPRMAMVAEREGVRVIELPMERAISPLADLATLRRLVRTLRELRPEIVNAGTTKAGLLGMLAAKIAGVPVRVYVLRGLRLETQRGARRALLTGTERIATACSNWVVCNSESLRGRFVGMGIGRAEETSILGNGSSNGVLAESFIATPARRELAEAERRRFGIPDGAPVVGLVGRLAGDKGVDALLPVLRVASRARPDLHLLLVGDFDEADLPPAELVDALRAHPRVSITGYVDDPAPYYLLMDVLVFPSLREGFPNVPLEAACAEVPVAGYRATGTVDAVLDGETGTLVELGDTDALGEAIGAYLTDGATRVAHGRAARERAERDFSPQRVWDDLADLYERLLERHGTDVASSERPILLSVDLEDWNQLLGRHFGDSSWDRPGSAFPRQLASLLDLLDRIEARATFFVLGVTAKNYPELVREIHARGHEMASHGFGHDPIFTLTPEQFREDVERGIEVLVSITGERPRGYRAPAFSLTRACVWALEVLADLGFEYDSSLNGSPKVQDRIRSAHEGPFRMLLPSGREMLEMPTAMTKLGPTRLPVGGGSYWRVLPYSLIRKSMHELAARESAPALYFHPYEFDPEPLTLNDARRAGASPMRTRATEMRYNAGRFLIRDHLSRLAHEFNFQTYETHLASIRRRSGTAALSRSGDFLR